MSRLSFNKMLGPLSGLLASKVSSYKRLELASGWLNGLRVFRVWWAGGGGLQREAGGNCGGGIFVVFPFWRVLIEMEDGKVDKTGLGPTSKWLSLFLSTFSFWGGSLLFAVSTGNNRTTTNFEGPIPIFGTPIY